MGLGQEGELVHHADHPAVGGLGQAELSHLGQLCGDEAGVGVVSSLDVAQSDREPLGQGGRWRQREQHRQECQFVHEQADLWPPENGRGVPVTEPGSRGLRALSGDGLHLVTQFLGCVHDQHGDLFAQHVGVLCPQLAAQLGQR